MTRETAPEIESLSNLWPDEEVCLLCGTAPFDLRARALHHLRAATDALLVAGHPDLALEVRVLAQRVGLCLGASREAR